MGTKGLDYGPVHILLRSLVVLTETITNDGENLAVYLSIQVHIFSEV